MAQISSRTTTSGEKRYDVRMRIGGRSVSKTFKRKRDAEAYAATTEADKLRGVAIDPRHGRITVHAFASDFVESRRDWADRTSELNSYLLVKYIDPAFGDIEMRSVTPSEVRAWHSDLAAKIPTTAAKAYRLLFQIMKVAVTDEVIARNPCQVKGAGRESAPERPVASIAEAEALASAMPESRRVAVLLAAWCQLRRGELRGLRRMDVDLLRDVICIRISRVTTMTGETIEKGPKTAAGRRTVSIPPNIRSRLQSHLNQFVAPEPEAWLLDFSDRALSASWSRARTAVGREDLHLHDLRHSGLTWAAATGATVAELMRRGGHSSPAAAIRYQHATDDRDKALADALAGLVLIAPVVPIGDSAGRGEARTEVLQANDSDTIDRLQAVADGS